MEAQRSQAHLRLSVVDNQYEDSTLQLVGEGYVDDITLDNITFIPQNIPPENQEGNMAEDDVSGRWPWAAGAVLLVCESGSVVWIVCELGSVMWVHGWTDLRHLCISSNSCKMFDVLDMCHFSMMKKKKRKKCRPFSQFLAIGEALFPWFSE